MTGQSYVLLALGVFAALIVTVAGIERYLLDEHPPDQVDGLLWRVTNATTRIRDLEMTVVSTEDEETPLRSVVRILGGPIPVLSVEYVEPESMRGQIYTVQRDLLSLYVPENGVTVVRRWMGLPLAAVGLAALDVTHIEKEWQNGRLVLQVVQEEPSLPLALTDTVLVPSTSVGSVALEVGLWPQASLFPEGLAATPRFGGPDPTEWATRLPTHYLLEVRNGDTLELMRTLWIDRSTFMVRRVVTFDGGRRRTVEIENAKVNQGLTAQDVLIIPRGGPVLRG
ncbi:MAG: hypothetical protein AB1778_08475 [Candidatus Bipolaricaulota bacterium]